jgi:hypothetical protein
VHRTCAPAPGDSAQPQGFGERGDARGDEARGKRREARGDEARGNVGAQRRCAQTGSGGGGARREGRSCRSLLREQQHARNLEPLGIEWTRGDRSACLAIPVASIGKVALLAMQIGVHPRAVETIVVCAARCAAFQSPRASYQSAFNASLRSGGGASPCNDARE